MKRRLSVALQLMIIMFGMVTLIIGGFLLFNTTFLEKYYVKHKQLELQNGYDLIEFADKNGTLESADFDVPFERLCANGNLDIMILDSYGRILQTSFHSVADYQRDINQLVFSNKKEETLEILYENDEYLIARRTDPRMLTDCLILVGNPSRQTFVYMRTTLESIHESASITNQFLLRICLGGLLLSLILIFFLSKKISRSLESLTDLSKRMADLDFDAHYEDTKGASREISELGASMNTLSSNLEQTISHLKKANNELQQDIRKKEDMDEMRKEFLSNVTHELKTPIALISGYAEGLRECINDDPESRDFYCEVIIDESEKMSHMVSKLLTLNHLEFGNEAPEMERFNLTELAEGVSTSAKVLAEASAVEVIVDLPQISYVWGDEFKIEEVLTNYLTNAIHYAQGEKKVRISCAERDQLLRISVFNTGAPIPEEELDKIWVKFYKIDKARTREYGGSGIGLSIVKAIMDAMNQKCGVINHENGVEFWFELEKA